VGETTGPWSTTNGGAQGKREGSRDGSLAVLRLPRELPLAPFGGRRHFGDPQRSAFKDADPTGDEDVARQKVARRRHGVRGVLLILVAFTLFGLVKVPEICGGRPMKWGQDSRRPP